MTRYLFLVLALVSCLFAQTSNLTITTTSLPSGTVGVPFSAKMAATGGAPPYFWISNLPAPLVIDNTGQISGTPTAAFAGYATILVRDTASNQDNFTFFMTINPSLAITTASLPSGGVGSPYSAQLAAAGGTAPYTWSASGLPAGLTINPSSGQIAGTSTAAGTWNIVITVVDSGSPRYTASRTLSLTLGYIDCIVGSSLPAGTVGASYSAVINNTCAGVPPYTWSAAGLPPGLTMDAANGIISGTPTAAFSGSVTVTLRDSSAPQNVWSHPFTLTIANLPTITTSSLATGTPGVPYSMTLAAAGGVPPYTWSAAGLPSGLAVNPSTGVISGIPTVPSSDSVTITVRDSASISSSRTFQLTIVRRLTIITESLLPGTAGSPYSAPMAAVGGMPPYVWSATSLPAPLTIDAASGLISGIPAGSFASNVTITVRDSANPQNSTAAILALTIGPALTITTTSLPNGTMGVPYSAQLAATGGAPPYAWFAVLPAPLAINSSGWITGLPVEPFSGDVTITVYDSAQNRSTSKIPLTINPATSALTILTATLANATVAAVYSAPVVATGGTPPYTWSAASLPPGLSIDPSTGQITGTPTAPQLPPGNVAITVQDSASPSGSVTRNYTLAVYPAFVLSAGPLPNGVVAVPYNSGVISATGGVPPYTWSVTGLPAPLTFGGSSASGQITGTPTAPFSGNVTFTVHDSSSPQNSTSQTLPLAIYAGLTITTSSLPPAAVGSTYGVQLTAAGGSLPYTWSAAGLPPPLTISPSGQISGTPTAVYTGDVMVTVKDNANPQASASQLLALSITPQLTITTASLPPGTARKPYSAQMTATGGTPPYSWSATLPAGLTMSSSGQISGTPATGFSGNVTITVLDSSAAQNRATREFALAIDPGVDPLTITTAALPNGISGVAYSATATATGGLPPYTWSATGLPAPLAVNPSSGQIAGVPTSAFSGNVTLTVHDSSTPQITASRTLPLAIAGLSVTTTSLPIGAIGAFYSTQLAAAGGVPPYSWSAAGLPSPLRINATSGQISGSPDTAFTGNVTVAVRDSATPQGSAFATFTLTVNPALTITTTTLPFGTAGSPYNAQVAAAGGVPPYLWFASLPEPLTINSSGQITGIPAAASTGRVTITVVDSSTAQNRYSQNFSLTINPGTTPPPGGLTITTGSLSAGTVGTPYSAAVAATGGTPPYTWSATGLPAPLTIGAGSGLIGGTPAATFSGNVTITVKDSASPQASASATLPLTVNPAASTLTITTAALSNATVGAPYSATLAATGGTPPYTWTATGLPLPLTINASTGQITGTPSVPQLTPGNVIITVKDSASPSNSTSRAYSLTVNSALLVSATVMPTGAVGVAYSTTPVSATGGAPPYTWSATGLPAPLTVNPSTGQVTGTPAAPFSGSVAFTVRDSSSPQNSATQTLSLTIGSGLTITTTSLPAGSLGAFYTVTLAAVGGTPPYTWSAAGLPSPLRINTASGQISGSPEAGFSGNVFITVRDSATPQASAVATLALTINGPLTITTTSLPSGPVGAPYSAQVVATGGTPPYSWFGSLPAPLTIDSSGLISGTPAAPFAGRVTITVFDSSPSQTSYTQYFSLSIGPYTRSLGAMLVARELSANGQQGPTPATVDPAFQVRYAANLQFGESFINISNDGANGAPLLGPGFGNAAGNICVNVYAFSPDEQLISCCSCLVTPNGLVNLGVNRDLTAKTLTGIIPSSVVVKLLSTLAGGDGTGTSCTNSAATATAASLAPGLIAWGTTLHPTPAAGEFAVAETRFSPATLNPEELASITGRCASIIGNGSGFGICKSCQAGALGGSSK